MRRPEQKSLFCWPLPNGGAALDSREYTEEWHSLGKRVTRALNEANPYAHYVMIDFDPGISVLEQVKVQVGYPQGAPGPPPRLKREAQPWRGLTNMQREIDHPPYIINLPMSVIRALIGLSL